MTKHSGPVRIISDGMGHNTVIMDGNDTVIDNIGAVTLFLAAGELNHADITVFAPVIDVTAEIGDVEILCPVCNEIQKHTCTSQTLGGN